MSPVFRRLLFLGLVAGLAGSATAQPDFSIGVTPSSPTLWQGWTGDVLVTITSLNGFAGSVALGTSGLPSGVTTSFSPVSVTSSGTSTLTFAATPGAALGNVSVSVTGTSGALVHSVTANLSVVTPPPIQYTYDAVGRLTSVTDQLGRSAIYSYDAVGNLLSIDRPTVGQVLVSAFSPQSGPVGTSITILGAGFSTTAAQNTIQFNGASTTAITATSTLLTAVVPPGVTSGVIGVSVGGGGSASSSGAFTVTSSPSVPTITSFSPFMGVFGTPITISGTNFSSLTTDNTVKIADTPFVVQGATTTALNVSAVATNGSGRISVQTSGGQAMSAGDFFFVPAPYTESNVVLAIRAAIGAPIEATFTATQTLAIVLFDGVQGQKARFLTNTSSQGQVLTVLNPDGTTLLSDTGLQTAGAKVIDTPPFGVSGTYAVLVKGTERWQGRVGLTIVDPSSSGDFSISSFTELYQNNPYGPAFRLFTNAGTGVGNIQWSASGLPSCASPSFNPAQINGTGSSRLTFTLTGCAAGSYPFSVVGTAGALVRTVNLTLDVNPLPGGWSQADIGVQGAAGSSVGTYTLRGGGAGNLFATDAFHFAYQSITGDGTIVARLTSLYNSPTYSEPNAIANGGIMIRDGLATNSTTVHLRLKNTEGAQLQSRTTVGGSLVTTPGPGVAAPYWMKLTRAGNVFRAFVSPDGVAWTKVGGDLTIVMSSSINIGLTVGANPFGAMAEGIFDNVSISTTADFSISASPLSQAVAPGGTANYTMSVAGISSFSGTVNFSVGALPSGVSATFAPTTISGSGNSTLSLATSAGTPVGKYPITVSGSDGSVTRAVPITLDIGDPDFTISVAPSSRTVWVNGSTTYTLTIAPLNGFSGVVALSATGVPPGTSVVFSPTSVTASGTSTATVTVGPNTPARSWPLILVGTSGSLVRSVPATLNITPTDFSISLNANWLTFPTGGGSATRTVTVSPANNFAQVVTLSVTDLPAGATASFSPPTINTSGTSTMTVTMPTGLASITYNAEVVGTVISTPMGNPSHSIPLVLVTQASGSLPSGWTNIDINSPAIPGSAGYDGGVYTVQGGGGGTGQTQTTDSINFLYKSVSGDATIIARITGAQNQQDYSSAGVMIRESTAANSKYVSTHFRTKGATHGPWLLHRGTTGGYPTNVGSGTALAFPAWLKLVRRGNSFSSFSSADGVTWATNWSVTVSMNSSVLIGLWTSAFNNSTLTTTTFDSVDIVEFSANPNPIVSNSSLGVTTLRYNAPSHAHTQIWLGEYGPGGVPFTGVVNGSSLVAMTGNWVVNGMLFLLVDTDTSTVLATVTVAVNTVPSISFSASPNPINSGGTGLGTTTFTFNAPGHTNTQIWVGAVGTGGGLLAQMGSSGSVSTGNWVTYGMSFFLIDLDTSEVLSTLVVDVQW